MHKEVLPKDESCRYIKFGDSLDAYIAKNSIQPQNRLSMHSNPRETAHLYDLMELDRMCTAVKSENDLSTLSDGGEQCPLSLMDAGYRQAWSSTEFRFHDKGNHTHSSSLAKPDLAFDASDNPAITSKIASLRVVSRTNNEQYITEVFKRPSTTTDGALAIKHNNPQHVSQIPGFRGDVDPNSQSSFKREKLSSSYRLHRQTNPAYRLSSGTRISQRAMCDSLSGRALERSGCVTDSATGTSDFNNGSAKSLPIKENASCGTHSHSPSIHGRDTHCCDYQVFTTTNQLTTISCRSSVISCSISPSKQVAARVSPTCEDNRRLHSHSRLLSGESFNTLDGHSRRFLSPLAKKCAFQRRKASYAKHHGCLYQLSPVPQQPRCSILTIASLHTHMADPFQRSDAPASTPKSILPLVTCATSKKYQGPSAASAHTIPMGAFPCSNTDRSANHRLKHSAAQRITKHNTPCGHVRILPLPVSHSNDATE